MGSEVFLLYLQNECSDSREAKLLRIVRDKYNVKLKPIEIQKRGGVGDYTWAESYTKLLAFNQTQYDRVLSLDSDSTVLQTMDELFLLPPSPVAMPRAYWLNPKDRVLSSQVVLITPRDSAFVFPHRPYDLLTGEFRSKKHESYLGNSREAWDPEKTLMEAKFLHFSDWPVPKPWLPASKDVIEKHQPTCDHNPLTGNEDDCRALNIWLAIYDDFKQ